MIRTPEGELRQDPVASRAAEDWISTHGAAYVGQWVALRGGEFLGASRSFRKLIDQLSADGSDGEDVLLAVID